MIRWFALVLTPVVALAANERQSWKDNQFTVKEIRRQPASVQMPASLWEKAEAFARQADPKLKPEAEVVTEFVGLKAFLIEKNRGILGREHLELKFPVGGGEFDLSDFVQPLRGTFYFATEFLPGVDPGLKKIYYLSSGVPRTLLGVKAGAGCDAYYDVTSAFTKALAGPGFMVNTTEGRHVSALAGTYFFLAYQDGKLKVASLTVRDSKERALQCRRS